MTFQVFPENADLSPCKWVKFGIDPTFSRLHLGHFVPLRLVKKMMEEGHAITIVLGTFTAQLGDPSGRDTTRPILSKEEVEKNADFITAQLVKILKFDKLSQWRFPQAALPGQWQIFRNGDVLNEMKLPEFLRIASEFSLTHMTSRNAFEKRIQEGHSIALHELLVPICQGWDSVQLDADIEIGGQDQLFNFQIARQLQERHGQKPQDCILMPIIHGTDGRKMSKSLNNCIWLDESPNDIFGKVMSISDETMLEWIPLFTDCRVQELNDPMLLKKMLAFSIVDQIHGEDDAHEAHSFFERTVQHKEIPEDIPEIKASNILEAVIAMDNISKTAARRLLADGGITINGEKVNDELHPVQPGNIIRRGKRKFARIAL
jgi:tyrosyl-tRNA synthetase